MLGENGEVTNFRFLFNLGELLLTNALDYERTPRYFLTIEAKDGGKPPLSSTTVATINVIDVNDNKPHFIGQDEVGNQTTDGDESRGLFSFEIYENSPIGTQIGRVSLLNLTALHFRT